MRRARLFVAFSVTLALTACASVNRRVPANEVLIADSVMLRLPPPAEVSPRLQATQLLSGRYEDETFDIQLNLEWREDAIVLVAFSLLGNTLFSMSYDGESITTVGNGLALRGLDTSYVLADILITYGDRELLETRLYGSGVEIVDERRSRSILRNRAPVVIIEYEDPSRWNGRVRYTHLERGYTYEIETVELSIQ